MPQTIISDNDRLIKDRHYTGSLSAHMPHEDGRPYHTFRTYTVLAEGTGLTFRDCVFENTAGPGGRVGQAIALYVDGDNIAFFNCTIRGHQDTLFLAPLPPKEYEPDGFLGPKQFAPGTLRTVTFRNCLIEGGVDFIFGGATAVQSRCFG